MRSGHDNRRTKKAVTDMRFGRGEYDGRVESRDRWRRVCVSATFMVVGAASGKQAGAQLREGKSIHKGKRCAGA